MQMIELKTTKGQTVLLMVAQIRGMTPSCDAPDTATTVMHDTRSTLEIAVSYDDLKRRLQRAGVEIL